MPISFISSDNLSASEIGGFRLAFNSGCFYRFYLISYNQFRNVVNFEKLILRNKDNYSEAIYLLPENKINIRNIFPVYTIIIISRVYFLI